MTTRKAAGLMTGMMTAVQSATAGTIGQFKRANMKNGIGTKATDPGLGAHRWTMTSATSIANNVAGAAVASHLG